MRLENFNAGAGVPTLNRNHLASLLISVPPKELQALFTSQIGKLFERAEYLTESNTKLKQSRDLLLPRLISGKLDVETLNITFPQGMVDESGKENR